MNIQQYSQTKLEKETNKIKTDVLLLKEKQFATVNLGSKLGRHSQPTAIWCDQN